MCKTTDSGPWLVIRCVSAVKAMAGNKRIVSVSRLLVTYLLLAAVVVTSTLEAATRPGMLPALLWGDDPGQDALPPPLVPGTTLRFDRYGLEQGLSESAVKAIAQDSQGFVWIGTEDGLNRFDGYGFRVYRHDPEDYHSLSNNNITALATSRSGDLWIGTYGGGLEQYEHATDRFIHHRHDPNDANSLSDDQVLAVIVDRWGLVWVGTRGGGLNRFEPQNGRWRRYQHDSEDPHSLSYDYVNAIHEDRSGAIWSGTPTGLNRLDRSSGQFTRYRKNMGDPSSLSSPAISTIYQDRAGTLWIGTVDGGLNRFDRETETFVHYRHDPEDAGSLSSDDVRSIVEDSAGVLWVGTNKGLNWLRRETGAKTDGEGFVLSQYDASNPHSLSSNQVRALYEDRAGGLWVGTYGGGLNRYDKQRQQFAHYRSDLHNANSLSESGVWSIYEDATGLLWIGTDGGGLNRLDRTTGEWRHYRHDPTATNSVSSDTIMSVYGDRSGALWIGTTGGGLDRMDQDTEEFHNYRYDPNDPQSLSSNDIWTVYEDRQGDLWVGTAFGLNRLDRATGQFTHYYSDAGDPHSLAEDNVGAIYEDRSGTLWFGTHGGLHRFDRQTEQFTRYQHDPSDPQSLSHDVVFVIYEDRSGALWLGTWGGGLNRFDRATETFRHYRVRDGLPNDVVYGILESKASPGGEGGYLWLSTNRGLARFDPQTETFRNYDAGDGLQSNEFSYNAYFQSGSGEMFFGGINGFNTLYPERIRDNPYVPPVVLTSLSRRGEAIDLGSAVTVAEQATFRWPDNDFEFEFAALSYYQPEKNQYAYMLEGLDEGWNYAGSRRFGGYTNLPGGIYTLRLMGSNNDGRWSEEATVLNVTVVSPFWATWWFRGLAILALAAVAFGIYRLRVRSIQARSRALETQVAHRTEELAALNAIAAVVSRSLDLDRILGDALEKTLEVLALDAGGIYLLEEDEAKDGKGVLRIAAHRGLSPEHVAGADNLMVGEGFSGRVVQTCEPIVVRDLTTDARLTRSVIRDGGFHTLAIAPIVSRAKVQGTLFVMSQERAEILPQDVELLGSIGGQIGMAIENARLFEAEQRRAEQFRVINQVDRHIASILDVDHLLHEIVSSIQKAFGYAMVGIGLIDGDEVVMRASAGMDWQAVADSPLRARVGDGGVIGWVARTGYPLIVPDVAQEPRYVRWPETAETRSELAVPLKTKSGVIGVLNVESEELHNFDYSDLVMLQSLASQAAIAIENAGFFAEEQRRAEQFRVIAEAGRRISLTLDRDQTLAELARLIQQSFGYYHVGIGLIEGDEVVYQVGAGALWDDPEFAFKPARLKVGQEGFSGWVAATGEPLLVPDVSQDARYVWLEGSECRSEVVIPIVVKGTVIGVLDAQSDRLHAFDDTDRSVLQSLANQVGAAIENAQLYEQAQHAAVVEERQRLARDLHDAVTQTLFSASLIAEVVPATWHMDQEEGLALLQELQQLTRGALAEMRTLLLELRPAALIESDFCDLLRQLAQAASGREGMPVTVTVEGTCTLPPDVHVALYRIAQEALNNVVKHARASAVSVKLRCVPPTLPDEGMQPHGDGRIELEVSDNGVGFDPHNIPPDHLGLGIMRERAETIGASLEMQSERGVGTRLTVVWEGDQRLATGR